MSATQAIVFVLIAGFIGWWIMARRARGLANASLPGATSGSCSDFDSLLQNGAVARGILLKVGTQKSSWQSPKSSAYYEMRTVTIDVEVPGSRPYEVSCSVYVPANLRPIVLPGATVELRVDPCARQNIAVYGPGVGLPDAVA